MQLRLIMNAVSAYGVGFPFGRLGRSAPLEPGTRFLVVAGISRRD